MHVLAEQIRSLDESVQAVDLGQSPAEMVFLSFSDSDLGLADTVHAALAAEGPVPTLRLANLSALRHPYSVDRYIETIAAKAHFVVVRCLGGADYWRYGVDELAMAARTRGFGLALLPGDGRPDARLAEASTLPVEALDRLAAWFDAGGSANMRSALGWIASGLGYSTAFEAPVPVPAFGCWMEACGCGPGACGLAGHPARIPTDAAARHGAVRATAAERPVALVVFYRALLAAGDADPVAALCRALAERGLDPRPIFVTSLKDEDVAEAIGAAIRRFRPDVVVNTTAFSARRDDDGSPLDAAAAAVIQAPIAATFREAWAADRRGLSAADLAMNVVLPEIDGRIGGPALSFKVDGVRSNATEYTRVRHRPEPEGSARAADLAAAWVRLRRLPRGERRVALVLSDYPVKGGRTGHAVGLDGPASLSAIADDLRTAGFDIGPLPGPAALIRSLEDGGGAVSWSIAAYRAALAELPQSIAATIESAWGSPEADPAVVEGAFRFRLRTSGKLILAVQPERGRREDKVGDHHDPNRPPRHAYVAFYLWLRRVARIDAMIHLGTHGTLEWLPGKAVALSEDCFPSTLVGAVPVIYPFIVNNPGEAAQAKRRIGALTIGHLTPPLTAAGSHGATAGIEALLDEFAAAQAMDPARARRLAALILGKAQETGLAADCGLSPDLDEAAALAALDAFLCDLKDMRIGDGLHVFGRAPDETRIAETVAALGGDGSALAERLRASAEAERTGLLAALDGRFVAPGPAGAPALGRLDVLPTGRNLYAVDPRMVPTRTAYDLGARTAEAVIARHVQDHGEFPRRIVLDLWGSASMRSGGEDLGQAFALLGVRPVWDAATARVSGFEVLSTARTGRPRVDVTLRISGLFRDVFPSQIALFDAAARAVAALEEDEETNPIAAAGAGPRVYGTAPGAYGTGIAEAVAAGAWDDRSDLGERYIAAAGHAYGIDGEGVSDDERFRERVRTADAFVHVQDLAGRDILDSDAFAGEEGGFAAALAAAGGKAALYHVDRTRESPTVRTLSEEIARVVRGRATNPRWIAGQMRHGHRGAAEIAETVAALLAFSATSGAVAENHFDLVFEATIGDDAVRAFMAEANPRALAACARSFDEAVRRGLWPTRRNSVGAKIAETLENSP